ncbi:MAG: ComF family protein [Phycisphaerales bacterium]
MARGDMAESGLASVWRAIETTWLGRERAPLAERMIEADWRPDLAVSYCGRCGTTAGPYEGGADGCTTCRGQRLAWDRAVRLGEYRGLVRETVHEIKFTRWRRLAAEMGGLLGTALLKRFEIEGVDPSRAVLVPVPTSFVARISRGIDHTLAIARGMADETGMPIAAVLVRRHRRSQTDVPASQRWANVAGAMRCESTAELSGKVVVIVDDIRTTGATLTAAWQAVDKAWKRGGEESGAEMLGRWVATLAVARRGFGRGRA